MSTSGYQRYRFGPIERRGLIGSLRPAQMILIAASLGGGLILMRTLSSGIGMVAALAVALLTVAFCFWPISGRPAEAWFPIVGRHTARRTLGRHVQRSPAPQAGVRPAADGRPEPVAALPEAGRELELLAAPFNGETVGVLKERRARSYTAVLAVRVSSFGLLDRAEQEARQAGWGGVLAGLAREGSPVSRIQWVERTVPADGDEVGRYLGEAWARETVPVDSLAMQSYLELTSSAPAVTRDHELFVSLQIDARRAWRQIKRTAGRQGTDAAACAVLLRELEALAERLTAADVRVVGALRPGMLALAVRVAFDPGRGPDSPGSPPPTPIATASTKPPPGHWAPRPPGAPTGPTVPSTPPTGSQAGRGSTSAPPSSLPYSCTSGRCVRSASRSSRSPP